jgi:hypothetical protein
VSVVETKPVCWSTTRIGDDAVAFAAAQVDDNCNGLYDEGCPTGGGGDAGMTTAPPVTGGSARDGSAD